MSAKIQLRSDYDSIRLRQIVPCCRDARQVRRLLALAAVYDGMSRAVAAKLGGMDRQTLRDHCPAGYAKHAREEGTSF